MTAAVAQLLLGAITAVLSLQLPLGTFRLPGSGLFPLALGLLLAALSAIQIARLLLAKSSTRSTAATSTPDDSMERKWMGAVVAMDDDRCPIFDVPLEILHRYIIFVVLFAIFLFIVLQCTLIILCIFVCLYNFINTVPIT